jgi:hypothetical protein
MPRFQLPEIVLSINTRNSNLQRALSYAFSLCKPTTNATNIEVHADTVASDRYTLSLPEWLATQIVDLDSHCLPIMFFGTNGELACGGAYQGRRFFAWTDTQQHIHFQAEESNIGVTLGYFHALISPLLREIYLNHNSLLLHAAGMQIGNQGILLIAPSGGGKTTTTIALLREQARMLADDMLVLKTNALGVTAQGIPKELNLRQGTIDTFEELQCDMGMSERLVPDKQPFTPFSTFGEDCLTEQCEIQSAYFIKLSSDGPSAIPTDAAQTMTKFSLAHQFCANQPLKSVSLQLITDVISNIRCFDLHTGPDPKQLGKWLTEHINSSSPNFATDSRS